MNEQPIFHLAIPVQDLAIAKAFYGDGLGCEIGRENNQAMIMNFYGHQVVAHLTQDPIAPQKGIYPRHFGLIFTEEANWEALVQRAKEKELSFYQEPKMRFPGQLTEHRTAFLKDPFGNLLEFKFYRHYEAIFAARELAGIGDR
ncbi:Glyoxalase/bleomycin resistance protein/dioxygenase [Gloeothece citriformis PCC 7424]|uniref:Glyoxalase/bleomycin resistance protein/dioxygenase n=1 Tax=Gloeothece citriformis (strain PCC 7424) TaxID=65393 RepID=B7K8N6_GLOC7|nr:VOC family protein [Gloeothece citriformis]ACK71234.1 Glyoxalase/bleomycin resistance protein/dioxygenase [Gloeothece citriformis PCC 7424]